MYGLGIVEIFDVLSPEECEYLIKHTESIGYDEATVNMGNEQHVMKPNLRNNSRVNITDDSLCNRVWDAIKSHIPTKIGDDHALFLDDTFRCYRYYPGEFFG